MMYLPWSSPGDGRVDALTQHGLLGGEIDELHVVLRSGSSWVG
jgi:hypothetical protein